jgi:hypothetical protein
MQEKFMKKFLVVLSVCLMSSAFAEKWDRYNNPKIFVPVIPGKVLKTNFAELPLDGSIKDERLGWSETYWPSNKGGIAYRWNHPDPQPFKYKILTKAEVLAMSATELSQLSPAELYDISQGDYNFTLTKSVLRKYSPKDLWWEGICHGWSLAASRYPEPDRKEVVNKDGVKVVFGSSDVKGLLAMHDAFNPQAFYVRVGRRCGVNGKVPGEESEQDGPVSMPSPFRANSGKCSDVNAGAFHLILTNMIGVHGLSFVADVDRFADVWNQPVTSYESKIISVVPVSNSEIRSGVAKKIRVATKFVYGEELQFYSPEKEAEGLVNFVSKEPVTGTIHQAFRHKNYEYTLELDAAGNIVGGEWHTDTRPDMLWGRAKEEKFYNSPIPLGGLNQIYTPVRR